MDQHIIHPANPFEMVSHLLPFVLQLRFIGKVLGLAATASLIDGANRFDPIGMGLHQLQQLAARVIFFDGFDPHPHRFTGHSQRDKNGESLIFAHTGSIMSLSRHL
jgi:hypothetical protein